MKFFIKKLFLENYKIWRIAGVALRFLLMLALAAFLNKYEYSQLVYLVAVVEFGSYLSGLDFYTYSNRVILKNNNQRKIILSTQFYLLMTSSILMGGLYYVFSYQKTEGVFKYIAILAAEVFLQELYRINLTCKNLNIASIIYGLKQSLWLFLLSVLFYFGILEVNLENVLSIWMYCSISFLIVGLYWIREYLHVENFSINVARTGVIASIPFYFSALSSRGMYFWDKYVLKHSHNELALYGFLITYFSVIVVVADILILMKSVGVLYHCESERNFKYLKEFSEAQRRKAIVYMSFVCTILWFALNMLGENFGWGAYTENKYLVILVMCLNIISVLNITYFQVLLVAGKGREVFLVQFSGLIILVFVSIILDIASASNMIISLIMIGVLQMISYAFCVKKFFRRRLFE